MFVITCKYCSLYLVWTMYIPFAKMSWVVKQKNVLIFNKLSSEIYRFHYLHQQFHTLVENVKNTAVVWQPWGWTSFREFKFFSLLIIIGWDPYNNIWVGVEFSPLSILLQVAKSKMAAIQISMRHNFVNIHDTKLILVSIPMFLRSGSSMKLFKKWLVVEKTNKSKMAAN